MNILFIVNDADFFLSHRLPLAKRARDAGYNVHIATMPGPGVSRIIGQGFAHETLPLSRSGRSFFEELNAAFAIFRLLWRIRPHILHVVTIKPVLYGGFAARFSPVRGVVAAVSGLGFVFVANGTKASLFRRAITLFYRFALGKRNLRVVFQNPDDRDVLVKAKAVSESKVRIIRGSGVDLSIYGVRLEPEGVPVVCMASRLLRDKGVVEFVRAAGLLKRRGVIARFQLIGDVDPHNPTSISERKLEKWRSAGVVEQLGFCSDIAARFAAAHVVVLPSYYGEGLPKVLMEAAACGRPVITTDHPGCRDAIEPGVTGMLVPVRNAEKLADAIEYLINHPEERRRMGRAGRGLAEREFAIEKIVDQHMAIYRELLEGA